MARKLSSWDKKLIELYLYLKEYSVELLMKKFKCSRKVVEQIAQTIDYDGSCPMCNGSEYFCRPGSTVLERCLCVKLKRIKKYLMPLSPRKYTPNLVPSEGFKSICDLTKHVVIRGNLSLSEIKFIFSVLLHEAGHPVYEMLTPYDLVNIQFKEHEKYITINNIYTPVLLLNGGEREVEHSNKERYMIHLLSNRENRNKPVWTYVPSDKFAAFVIWCEKEENAIPIIELKSKGTQLKSSSKPSSSVQGDRDGTR